jgi:hypothetical protein
LDSEKAEESLAAQVFLDFRKSSQRLGKMLPADRRTASLCSAYVAGVHVLNALRIKDVDGRDKPGHDEPAQSKLSIKSCA